MPTKCRCNCAGHAGINMTFSLLHACCRNQSHQEQLWEISCNMLKDYLSPDIWREYGPSETGQQGGEATANEQGEETHGTLADADGPKGVPVTTGAPYEQQ